MVSIKSPKLDRSSIIKCPTSHLNHFQELSESTGLIGEEYHSIFKLVWYSMLSLKIATKSLSLGSLRVDGRIHPLIVMKSGGGKSEIKRTIESILKHLNYSFIEPTSFHPEQFIGKVRIERENEERTYRQIPGHFSLDYLLIDEGKSLLESKDPNFSESRKHLRIALDSYPSNTITKRSVDIEHEHALKYEPHIIVCIFVQPYSLSDEIVLDGDLRRFIVSYLKANELNVLDSLRDRLRTKIDHEKSLESFADFLGSLKVEEDFELEEGAKKVFEDLSVLLVELGSTRTIKSMKFVEIVRYTIQNILLKFSAVQALQDNSHIIEEKHVELAFVDYVGILENTYDFVEDKILGSMDYGAGWAGALKHDQEVLRWLHKKGAVSQETSSVSIKDYQMKIMEVFNVEERQARRKKKAHEDQGWIESKKGQYDSKVWLTFMPNTYSPSEVSRDRVDKTFREKYQGIIGKHFNNK